MKNIHLSCRIVTRSKKHNIIAKAAYRAGEKLQDEETHKEYDYTHKKEVVFSEILLCENAPKEYADRRKLWTAVQQVEKDKNSQLARDINIAFPKEFNLEMQKKILKEYIQKNFVSQGMIADYSIHEKETNPHAHILLTMREIDENGNWKSKRKTDYARDENGEKIPILDENGKQKLGARNRKLYKRIEVDVNDWNKREKIEEWRKNWAEICNQYLSPENKVDHRSYYRQGIDRTPQMKIGVQKYMSKKGIKLFCNKIAINQKIKELWEQAVKIKDKLLAEFEKIKQKEKVKNEIERRFNGIMGNDLESNSPIGTGKKGFIDKNVGGLAWREAVNERANRENEQERRRIAESKRIEQEKQRQRDRTERKGNSEQPKRKRTFDIER